LGALGHSAPTFFLNGLIAEYWLTNTDIQPDGAQLDDNLLRQLAYGGPFSVPHIAKDLIEYRSFRKVIESDQDEAPGDEVYWGGAGRQVWTNTNGVRRGPHPPLPGYYKRPRPRQMLNPYSQMLIPSDAPPATDNAVLYGPRNYTDGLSSFWSR